MHVAPSLLRTLLVKPGHVDASVFERAREKAKKAKVPLENLLVSEGILKDSELGRIVADYLGFPFMDIQERSVDEKLLHLVPEVVARSRGVVVIEGTKDGYRVGMRDPLDIETRHFIEKRVGGPVFPYYITERGLKTALLFYRSDLRKEFQNIIKKFNDPLLSREERDKAIVRIVDMIIQYAYDNQASDIHIEPWGERCVIRYRIDGVLHKVLELPKNYFEFILARIKILARMRIDEHLAAQDGKIKQVVGEQSIEIRVSVVPVTAGENVVMRILSSRNRQFSLKDLGLAPADLSKVQSVIKKPHGMILVTGPTGSGKTTTLYSIVKVLNVPEVHIATIEDPVEYDIEGVTQIQVNKKTNLTFANGLRAIVRQDPDIIMVGEIRDEETADIAINSAMTGHLVLSTLHANDAATTLPRLIDMGVEPFLVASTVQIIIAQRLVRKICVHCRVSAGLSKEEKMIITQDPDMMDLFKARGKDIDRVVVYRGTGCRSCEHTGYRGRIGIFEILVMDNVIYRLVIERASSAVIQSEAKKRGMRVMFEDGLDKIFSGITTFAEVYRVTRT